MAEASKNFLLLIQPKADIVQQVRVFLPVFFHLDPQLKVYLAAHKSLNILAGLDSDPRLAGAEVTEKKILAMHKLPGLCRRVGVHIGIITVPGEHAQAVCDQLIDSGILAVWNFANAHLSVPEGILVQNENMAVSLALLSNHLKEVFSTK